MPSATRPNPQEGVFETLLVAAGRPLEVDAHLARLGASLRELFGDEVPTDARELVHQQAEGIGLGRLRLTVAPGGSGGLEATAATAEVDPELVFPGRDEAVDLHGHLVEGGLGAHKWADRALLDRAEAEEPGAVPLLLDRDGSVLEASRGHIFIARANALITPPLDGRILPGIARARVIEVARETGIEVSESGLERADVLEAEEAFLTGSVRGVEPVRSLDGAAVSQAGSLGARVASRLRRRWLG